MTKPRVLAFYLPQYHPIPENDKWWGKGFTEWVNVARARPRFFGHHQPRLPADLGFYDLRLEETRIAQAELAKAYGIYGFCYYHYWFNGKMMLERPFNEVLTSGRPDFPFCLCWANENWTRRWDGQEKDILMEQDYDKYDFQEHIAWLLAAFSDERYIRINGKPLFLIYRTDNIPNLAYQLERWREAAREHGHPGLYLCSVKSFNNRLSDSEALNLGFDALVDFVPSRETLPQRKIWSIPKFFVYSLLNKIMSISHLDRIFGKLRVSLIYSYEAMASNMISRPTSKSKTFPCVLPGWDNSARRQQWATIIQNDNALTYQKLLQNALKGAGQYAPEEQLVFINAWNEWAEGCYLEPDIRNGRKFLEATLEAIRLFGA